VGVPWWQRTKELYGDGLSSLKDAVTADYAVGTFSQVVSIVAQVATERERGGSQQIDNSLAAGAQDQKGTNDTVATTVSVIVFWRRL
jgi:hypothetical protein